MLIALESTGPWLCGRHRGKAVVVCGADDAGTGPLHLNEAVRLFLAPDGSQLASASSDRTVRVWSLQRSPAKWAEAARLEGHSTNLAK